MRLSVRDVAGFASLVPWHAVGGLLAGLLFCCFVYFFGVQAALGLWLVLAGLITLAVAQDSNPAPKTPLVAMIWIAWFGLGGITLCLTGLLMIYGP